VLFDLDGTLYESPWYLKLKVTALLLGDLAVLRHVNPAREWVRGRRFEDGDALVEAFHGELGRRAGLAPGQARAWYEQRFIASFLRVLEQDARARPGLASLLRELRERGLRIAVLSDYGRVAERIEALRLPVTLFDDLASAEDAGALKPSPLPFIMSARNLGLEPDEVLVVGDRKDMDGQGARAAGMAFLHVDRWPRVVRELSNLDLPPPIP
jgi:HAD superfamily hydrolase (TIGR01549 family)